MPEFDYTNISGLKPFTGEQPEVMKQRIALKNWDFHPEPEKNKLPLTHRLLNGIEDLIGWRLGEYKNYRII